VPRWHLATTRFGAGDRGTPGAPNDGIVVTAGGGEPAAVVPPPLPPPAAGPPSRSELIVRVLDVGQGDATFISNGTSRVIIDGGPDTLRFGRLLDSLGLNGATIDVVVLSHEHYDHHAGLRELFRSSRHIAVRYFFENEDPYTNAALERLRDSVRARVARGETVARDSDDPCGDGRPICTITMNGGAKLHIMRPNPAGTSPNDRSTPVKLVGPDSASFTMWLAGDAEHEEIAWFANAGYDRMPGMKVRVLKGDHHGSCNGVSSWYLRATDPEVVTFSVGRDNGYGHVHAQAKALYARFGKPWYRTDENGTIVFRSPGTPGGGYTVDVLRGGRSLSGSGDRVSSQGDCNPIP
jgi:competence protein ComEC